MVAKLPVGFGLRYYDTASRSTYGSALLHLPRFRGNFLISLRGQNAMTDKLSPTLLTYANSQSMSEFTSISKSQLRRMAEKATALEDQLSSTAARARDFEVQASTLTGDLNTMHDELEHSRQLNKTLRDDFDRMKRERDILLNAKNSGGTGTACGGSSSVGCSSGVSATQSKLVDMAREVLLESLTNGRWIEYPELRNFVLNRFKD
ncbi:MAG: hypothetical protein [Caudoviricetes sp.]|nr:MAG: hypothetical protein [Caudoviricetes sp.]